MSERGSRRKNGGVRKRCECPSTRWPKCPHSWHFNFKWKGVHHRVSLDRELSKHIDSKSEALAEAERIRTAIRAGEYGVAEPSANDGRFTFAQVADIYLKQHVAVNPLNGEARRPGGRALMELHIRMLRDAHVPDGGGGTIPLASKALDDVTRADLDAIRDGWPLLKAAGRGGRVGVDKALKRLRHLCNWAVERGHASRTPFKTGNGVVAFHFSKEQPRSRRLEGDEEERLLRHAGPLLRPLVIAALETACRRGELLDLRWRDVKWDQNVLLIPASISKTAEARDVPMTQRLRSVLELRRHAPDGTEHDARAYVFGNELGERPVSIRGSWERCCAQAGVRGLVFHDLRREAASRLRESGAPDHVVAAWLGHANITTTSRYLRTSRSGLHRYLADFELHRERCTSVAQGTGAETPIASPEPPQNHVNLLN